MKTERDNEFIEVNTIHTAAISWWWAKDRLHDDDYRISINEAVDAKVKELEQKYEVKNDSRSCFQFEGISITGESLENVTSAASELAELLGTFDGVAPLSSYRQPATPRPF